MLKNKKKLLFVLPDLSGGGAERVTLDLINLLNKNKFDITLFCLRRHGEYLTDVTNMNIKVTFGINGQISFVKGYKKIMIKLEKSVKEADLVIGSLELKGHLFATIAANKHKKPVIGWVHKHLGYYLDSLSTPKRLIYKTVTKLLYRKMSKIVTVSEVAKKSIDTIYPEFKNKTHYIYNPIDIEKIREESNMYLPDWFLDIKNKPIILAIGRLEFQKGFDILIESFSDLVNKKNFKGSLVILGEGSLREELLEQIKKYKLERKIFLPGFYNPYPIIKNSNLFVLSSRYEGLPTVLLEALALKKPIISVDCPSGPSEILDNGKFGTLVQPDRPLVLAAAIEKFFRMNSTFDLPDTLAEEGIKRFTKNEVGSQWEKLLISIK